MARILIVEDEEDFTFLLKDVLTGAGHEAEAAKDGREALEKIEAFRPEVVLLDWNMPVMDGEEFCRRLRTLPQGKVPVILLTVKKDEASELEALHFGADDFLPKPFQPEELLARVRAVLRRSAAA